MERKDKEKIVFNDSRIRLIIKCYTLLSKYSVKSSTGQEVPSHPELEVEWLPSSEAVGSDVTSLPGNSILQR